MVIATSSNVEHASAIEEIKDEQLDKDDAGEEDRTNNKCNDEKGGEVDMDDDNICTATDTEINIVQFIV